MSRRKLTYCPDLENISEPTWLCCVLWRPSRPSLPTSQRLLSVLPSLSPLMP
ncbi:hypothetical protein AYX13_03677, partial [Cryptococcus neoformans]